MVSPTLLDTSNPWSRVVPVAAVAGDLASHRRAPGRDAAAVIKAERELARAANA